jgi:hypothetical protein
MKLNNNEFSKANYLIYVNWESKYLNSIIAGSNLIGSALTEDEAKSKVDIYTEIYTKLGYDVVYITNKNHWWN